jgi:hypothetical protein
MNISCDLIEVNVPVKPAGYQANLRCARSVAQDYFRLSPSWRFLCRHTVARLSSNAPQHNLLCLFRARLLGGTWVKAMAKKNIPAAKTYELTRISPRRAGGTAKVRFSFKTAPVSANPLG